MLTTPFCRWQIRVVDVEEITDLQGSAVVDVRVCGGCALRKESV